MFYGLRNRFVSFYYFKCVISFSYNIMLLRINFYLLRTFCPHLGSLFFCVVSSFTTFRPNFTFGLLQVILWRPWIGMMSLVTVSPVITDFHSCLSHHVFDQVNLWPAWVGFKTAIFWQCSPGTVETQRLYPLCHGPRRIRLQDSSRRNVVKEEPPPKKNCARTHQKKGLVPHLPASWGAQQILQQLY